MRPLFNCAFAICVTNPVLALAIPGPVLLPRSTPGPCLDACNLAHLEIQSAGDNTAVLCASGSAFLAQKEACFICNSANGGDDSDFPDVNSTC